MTRTELIQNYRECALHLLLSHDTPTTRDVHTYLCYRDNCPGERCEYPGGFRRGIECGHVSKVKHLIDRVIEIANEE